MKKFLIFLLIILILGYGAHRYLKYIFPLEYSEIIEQCATNNNLEKSLIYAVIKAESNFKSDATSHKNAVGLMQITKETGEWSAEKTGIKDYEHRMLVNPEINIKIGTWYLSYLISELNNEDYAVMAYNAGINNVKKWVNNGTININNETYTDIPFGETKKYIFKVKIYKRIYEILYQI